MGNKGVMDIPVKLAVVFLILSISIPVVASAVEHNDDMASDMAMNSEMSKFNNAVAAAHYSGTGNTVTVILDIPYGFELGIGGIGPDSYSVRSYRGDGLMRTQYMEHPAVMLLCDITLDHGHHTLSITSALMDGKAAVEVSVI